jgi:mRNA-degrading endonuclease RelE of RelBE toxin-antitoxin system
VTHAVVWLPEAMTAYRSVRDADPDGATRITRAVALLASQPFPGESTSLGGSPYRRLRLDRYRVLYEVETDTVRVMHVGAVLQVPGEVSGEVSGPQV